MKARSRLALGSFAIKDVRALLAQHRGSQNTSPQRSTRSGLRSILALQRGSNFDVTAHSPTIRGFASGGIASVWFACCRSQDQVWHSFLYQLTPYTHCKWAISYNSSSQLSGTGLRSLLCYSHLSGLILSSCLHSPFTC